MCLPIFPKFVESEEERPLRIRAAHNTALPAGLSQSERDWAYVVKELKRGADPGQLQLHLEQSRQDKPNPRYYAHRTVARAVRVLANSDSVSTDIRLASPAQSKLHHQPSRA